MLKNLYQIAVLLFFFSLLFSSCNPKTEIKKDTLKVRVSADANSLNPPKARGETSNYICMQLFQTLIAFDYESNQAVGV